MIVKDVLTAVIATFCLTATLFLIVPTNSQYQTYDPWLDINDDGVINMLDLYYPALSFGAVGDTTKNVTVTNWPTRQALNACLADQLVILDGETVDIFAEVDGYSRLTLVLDKHYGSTLWLFINLVVGGVYTPLIYSNNSIPNGRHFILQSYEVVAPTIHIEIVALGASASVSLGIYATD